MAELFLVLFSSLFDNYYLWRRPHDGKLSGLITFFLILIGFIVRLVNKLVRLGILTSNERPKSATFALLCLLSNTFLAAKSL